MIYVVTSWSIDGQGILAVYDKLEYARETYRINKDADSIEMWSGCRYFGSLRVGKSKMTLVTPQGFLIDPTPRGCK
jgi:hypothetical protein